MTHFPDRLPVFAVSVARLALLRRARRSPRRCARRRRCPASAAMTASGTCTFATTRGNCSSGYSVPFTVTGSRVSSAGGGRVSGSVNRGGGVAVQVSVGASHATGGGRLAGDCRRRLLERHHLRRPLQRHLAGDAELPTSERKRPATDDPSGPLINCRLANVARRQRGASTITTWRPSNRASCSTLANSATSALTLSSSLVPISWCAISRPR